LLLGYALFGKGFAYLGYPPVYVGELVLLAGCFTFLLTLRSWIVLKNVNIVLLLMMMIWGACRTLPYLSTYGSLALRDAALWGYGSFGIIIAGYLMTRPTALDKLLDAYATFVTVFTFCAPVVWFLSVALGLLTVTVEGKSSPLIKGTEVMAHLAGVVAFVYLHIRRKGMRWLWAAPILFFMGMNTRAGILSVCVSTTALLMLRPNKGKWLIVATVVLVTGASFIAFDIRVKLPWSDREVSTRDFVDSVASVYTQTGDEFYDGTKRWRLMWWQKIFDYTWNGEYFWTGKGFGVNLADADGFSLDSSHTLRSPHNSHLTVLARAGVPGALLWLLVQLCWGIGMLRTYVICRRASEEKWANMFLFLLIYWIAFMISAGFDVFLEGPMAGIWFWTIYGTGAAARSLYFGRRTRAGAGMSIAALDLQPVESLSSPGRLA
jgi:hypothetical protein